MARLAVVFAMVSVASAAMARPVHGRVDRSALGQRDLSARIKSHEEMKRHSHQRQGSLRQEMIEAKKQHDRQLHVLNERIMLERRVPPPSASHQQKLYSLHQELESLQQTFAREQHSLHERAHGLQEQVRQGERGLHQRMQQMSAELIEPSNPDPQFRAEDISHEMYEEGQVGGDSCGSGPSDLRSVESKVAECSRCFGGQGMLQVVDFPDGRSYTTCSKPVQAQAANQLWQVLLALLLGAGGYGALMLRHTRQPESQPGDAETTATNKNNKNRNNNSNKYNNNNNNNKYSNNNHNNKEKTLSERPVLLASRRQDAKASKRLKASDK
ncbi:unnamed protein product [Polarella glacialis]|uniref:Uncharacterized protein n=1 Tax=Polarella glacialis TaxID=89957 RepID=A0A813GWL4_POLGL|nr:unnamed protein product [Polarella glacialis]CAE8629441.1 unnamed protein product [Polarella glacialis]